MQWLCVLTRVISSLVPYKPPAGGAARLIERHVRTACGGHAQPLALLGERPRSCAALAPYTAGGSTGRSRGGSNRRRRFEAAFCFAPLPVGCSFFFFFWTQVGARGAKFYSAPTQFTTCSTISCKENFWRERSTGHLPVWWAELELRIGLDWDCLVAWCAQLWATLLTSLLIW
jgi:hypothetical protein